MATFNGAAYVEEQVRSILDQLAPDDELIVVDDCSSDDTVELLQRLADARMVIHSNDRNRGHVFAFERAIRSSRHTIVLMADQDDRWSNGRVSLLVDALCESGALVASSNSSYMNAAGEPIDYESNKLLAGDSRRYLKNVLSIFRGTAGYFGCAMAFRKEIVPLILPVPRFVESHDLWIAMASNLIRSNVHVERDTLTRRIHGKNASLIRRSMYKKLRTRLLLLRALAVLVARYRVFSRQNAV